MKLYKVTWNIEIEANDPEEAARFASETIDDKTGQVFGVTDLETYETTTVDVDQLLDEDRIQELEDKINLLVELQNSGEPIDESYLLQLANELDGLKGER